MMKYTLIVLIVTFVMVVKAEFLKGNVGDPCYTSHECENNLRCENRFCRRV